MSQVVDLTDYATSLSSGYVSLQLSGYVSKFKAVSTNKIKLQLLDGSGNAIPGEEYMTVGTTGDYDKSWQKVTINLTSINSGTRAVRVILEATINSSEEAYADYVAYDGIELIMSNSRLIYSEGAFFEAAANDGSISTTKTVTLTGDTFVEGPFVQDTHYSASNVPAGMTLTVARDSATQVTLSLTGNAITHENADDVVNLTITFLDAAFGGGNAAGVVNSTKNDMVIDFNDAPVLSYIGDNFIESTANDGTVTTTKVVTLTGDAFVAVPFTEGVHYTSSNVPAGLTLTVTRNSASMVTLSLIGKANVHENANDVTNLTISFLDAAFTGGNASAVINATKNDMAIDFADMPLPSISIDDVTHDEGNADSTLYTFTISLSTPAGAGGVTFNIATADNTANADIDYNSNILNEQIIAEGNSTFTFSVIVHGDTTYEDDETFFVNISNVTGANVLDGQGIGTILNDDIPPITLQSIAITAPASKLVYTVAEALDINGMVVTGTYSDGSSKQETITAANVTGFNSSTPAVDQVLTVNVGGKTTTYTVTINAAPTATLVSIAITTPANKLVYTVSEALDITGLEVTGTYSDGSTKIETITVGNITGFDSTAPAVDQVLTVTVGGKTATYTVTVNAELTPTPTPSTPEAPIYVPTPTPTPEPTPEPKFSVKRTGDEIKVEVDLTAEVIEYYDGLIALSITSEEILDDLENEKISGVQITVNLPEQGEDADQEETNLILESELIKKAKENEKGIEVEVKDADDKVLYSWTFDNKELVNSNKDITDVNLSLKVGKAPEDAPYLDEQKEDDAVALVVDFAHEGVLPAQASVRLYVGNQEGITPGKKVYLYHYNESIGKLETIPYGYQAIVDEDGYITINILQCSDYIVFTKEADSKQYVSLRNQIKVTPAKITLSMAEGDSSSKIEVKLPVTLEWVSSLDQPTSQSAIGGVTIKFTSGDNEIATVDSQGNITAKTSGEVVIKVKITLYNKKTKTVKTKVKVKP